MIVKCANLFCKEGEGKGRKRFVKKPSSQQECCGRKCANDRRRRRKELGLK